MRHQLTAILVTALLACAACKGEQRDDDDPIEPPTTATQTNTAPANTAAQVEPHGEPSVPESNEFKSFGELIVGFQSATVTMNDKFPGPVKVEGQLDLTADHVMALVDAVGSDTVPSQGVPKCPMSYTFTFHGDAEDTVMSGVCNGSGDEVLLVWNGLSYRAANPTAVMDVLKSVK